VRFRLSWIAITLATLPAMAPAQRVNVRGERAGNVGGRGFVMPKASDLENHSPVGVVLDSKKKLSLSDSQLTALQGIARELHNKNADFYRMWDSVRVSLRSASGGAFGSGASGDGSAASGGGRSSRGGDAGAGGGTSGGGMTDADQERLATARTRMTAVMRAIREGDEWSRLETLKVLTGEQQTKAGEFWQADAEDFQTGMPRGGMPGGGPPDRGRPPR